MSDMKKIWQMEYSDLVKCSKCGIDFLPIEFNYCPQCGKKVNKKNPVITTSKYEKENNTNETSQN